MTTQTSLRYLLALASLLLFVAGVTGAQQSAGAPIRFLPVAALPAMDFAMQMVHLGIPAGLEIRWGEDRPSVMPRERKEVDADVSIPLTEIVASFNASHQEYQASLSEGVVIVRPNEGRAPLLERDVDLHPSTATGALKAITTVFGNFQRSLINSGMVGSVGDADEIGDLGRVSFGGKPQTVVNALNKIVIQIPGQGWVITTQRSEKSVTVVAIGLMHREGRMTNVRLAVPIGGL